MEYVYAALILNETGEEINEENLTSVLEAAGTDVEESRVKALVAALERGQIYGAGLDVHEKEPLAADHPLTTFDNVALTPHIAWYTEESYVELKRRAIENVAQVVTGAMPRNILNPEVLQALEVS